MYDIDPKILQICYILLVQLFSIKYCAIFCVLIWFFVNIYIYINTKNIFFIVLKYAVIIVY